MNRKIVLHRIAERCGACLPLLLIIGLLVPGCAGKRSDMLSSLIKPKQDPTQTDTDRESASDGDASSLIAGADSKLDNSQLSAFSAEEIIEGQPRLAKRVRSWFTRDSDALAAGDPFLDNDATDNEQPGSDELDGRKAIASSESSTGEPALASYETSQPAEKEPITDVKPWWQTGESAQQRQGVAGSDSRRVDELLSSFPSKQARQPQPERDSQSWWEAGAAVPTGDSGTATPSADALANAESPKTTFSRQFDSRLERLRAELNLDDDSVAAAETADDAPTAGLAAEMQDRPHQQSQPERTVNPTIAATTAAEEFNPFGTADEESRQLPIVAGNGTSAADQEFPSLMTQPRQSTNAPPATGRETQASDLKQGAVPEQPAQALASNPFEQTDELRVRSAGPPFGFEQLERLGNPWTTEDADEVIASDSADPTLAQSAKSKQVEGIEPTAASTSSGVSLLPPDDDFPSDAEGRDWSNADPRDIRLANHRFSGSPSDDRRIREQMRGLSAEDNQALLRSIADQKNRVLMSKGVQWPELPAAHQPAASRERSDGPIVLAQAPRYTLADDMAIAASPDLDAEGATPAAGGSLLGQFWHSQPIWLIGGLVLLVAALRLLPWPRKEEV